MRGARKDMYTYSFRVLPTDLSLEFREADEQNYIKTPSITRFPCCHELCLIRGAGDVGSDVAQRFEFAFLVLSARHNIPGKPNTVPCSTSSHSGATRVPVYLTIPSETDRGGANQDVMQKVRRTSRSSRTLVPCRGRWNSISKTK